MGGMRRYQGTWEEAVPSGCAPSCLWKYTHTCPLNRQVSPARVEEALQTQSQGWGCPGASWRGWGRAPWGLTKGSPAPDPLADLVSETLVGKSA